MFCWMLIYDHVCINYASKCFCLSRLCLTLVRWNLLAEDRWLSQAAICVYVCIEQSWYCFSLWDISLRFANARAFCSSSTLSIALKHLHIFFQWSTGAFHSVTTRWPKKSKPLSFIAHIIDWFVWFFGTEQLK